MKILFAPSEAKFSGGEYQKIDKKSFLFEDLFEKRLEFLKEYNNFLKVASKEELAKLFGVKKDELIKRYKINIFDAPIKMVIDRYDGVAYDYLDMASLDDKAKSYIYENLIIFSNLYGPLRAKDLGIVEYKLKQGESVGDIKPEQFYKKHFSEALDRFLEDEDILDLRAGFYNKFYKPKKSYTTLKFIKDDKVVSHWAKAYRGKVLRELAKNSISSLEEFMELEIEDLKIKDILIKGVHKEIVYEISK